MATEYEAEAQNEDGTPDLTVHVQGYMFNWDYEYFRGDGLETGVKTTRRLTVPANRLVLLEITSRDVQHSFWVSDLAGKVDAIPGYTNTMWLKVKEPGLYKGNCAEYCGTSHYAMVIEVEALESAAFETWLTEQEALAAEFHPIGTDMESKLPPGDEERGETLFASPDLMCANCHGARPGAGPSLAQIRGDTDSYDDDAEHFLRESILLPCAQEFVGYSCKSMPSDYGEKLDAQMLADLIEYLRADED